MNPRTYQGMRTKDGCIVTCNGRILEVGPSLKIRNHSPEGFDWGYPGTSSAQLALAILLHECPMHVAICLYRDFKSQIIARFEDDWFTLTHEEIYAWLCAQPDVGERSERASPDLGIEFLLIKEDETPETPPGV